MLSARARANSVHSMAFITLKNQIKVNNCRFTCDSIRFFLSVIFLSLFFANISDDQIFHNSAPGTKRTVYLFIFELHFISHRHFFPLSLFFCVFFFHRRSTFFHAMAFGWLPLMTDSRKQQQTRCTARSNTSAGVPGSHQFEGVTRITWTKWAVGISHHRTRRRSWQGKRKRFSTLSFLTLES